MGQHLASAPRLCLSGRAALRRAGCHLLPGDPPGLLSLAQGPSNQLRQAPEAFGSALACEGRGARGTPPQQEEVGAHPHPARGRGSVFLQSSDPAGRTLLSGCAMR